MFGKSLKQRLRKRNPSDFSLNFTNLLILVLLLPTMEYEKDISIEMAEDALTYIYNKYPNLSCGEYMSFASVLTHSVAKWIARSMDTSVKEVDSVIFAQCIQLEMLEEKKDDS